MRCDQRQSKGRSGLKGGCTPGAKLRYARDACGAKLRGFQLLLCICNMCVHVGCEATPAMLATLHALFDR